MIVHQLNSTVPAPASAFFERQKITKENFQQMKSEELKYKETQLKKAMEAAWADYGPDSTVRKEIAKMQKLHPVRSTGHIVDIIVNPFQPTTSEWDDQMTEIPVSVFNREVPQPSWFNRALKSYILFEVNDYETADFARRFIAGVLVGNLIAGWVILGMFLGIIPLELILFGKRALVASSRKRNAPSIDGHSTPTEIAGRIWLALDLDWLKELENRVRKDPRTQFTRTYAHCCVLPNEGPKGTVECQLIHKPKANNSNVGGSGLECPTDLIYDFEFGPKPGNSGSTMFKL